MLPFEKKMKKTLILLVFAGVAAFAQQAPAAGEKPGTVVRINGRDFSKTELESMVRAVGGNVMANFYADKRSFMEQLALTLRLEQLAEERGMPDEEPYKSRLAYNRTMLLATAIMSENQREAKIMPEEQQKYYAEHKSDFQQAKTKIIYLPFGGAPGSKTKTEDEARALAEDVVKQARGGAAFVDLVKKYSEDPDSKQNDGDFPAFKPTDETLPAPVKTAVFGLKAGQVSDAIRQPNGYYIFRLESFILPDYDSIKDEIFLAIQKERFDKWMDGVRKSLKVEVKDEEYMKLRGPVQP